MQVVAQYVDILGKCQLIQLDGATLIVEPCAPFSGIPILKPFITFCPFDDLQKINNLVLNSQSLMDEKIVGVWGKWSLTRTGTEVKVYIPLVPNISVLEIPTRKALDVSLFQEKVIATFQKPLSKLQEYEKNKTVATMLKHYVLYEYSLHPGNDPEFEIIKGYEYKINELNNLLFKEENDVMYSKGKLIVTDKKVGDKLLHYLKSQLVNDQTGVLHYKDKTSVADYKNISAFRSVKHQNVFMSRENIAIWLSQKETYKSLYKVQKMAQKNKQEPYFLKIKNKIVMIQNVKTGDTELAKFVSYLWNTEHINHGYTFDFSNIKQKEIELIAHVYSINNIKKIHNANCSIFDYGDGKNAAVLIL